MLSLASIGIRLEQQCGFVRVGIIYLLSGFDSSLLSSLFLQHPISVGASGALFGLLGAMLSELITNWSIYTNKVATLVTVLLIVVINLAVGILPHMDNFAHIGVFLSGFYLRFVLLSRLNSVGLHVEIYLPVFVHDQNIIRTINTNGANSRNTGNPSSNPRSPDPPNMKSTSYTTPTNKGAELSTQQLVQTEGSSSKVAAEQGSNTPPKSTKTTTTDEAHSTPDKTASPMKKLKLQSPDKN